MGVVVYDSDVLIGFLDADDAHHEKAVEVVRDSMAPSTRRVLCAVNYSEILVGPIKADTKDVVDGMLGHFGVEIITVDMDLAKRAAAVRARTGVALPDAYALATAIHAEHRGEADVSLATFDKRLAAAHSELHPQA